MRNDYNYFECICDSVEHTLRISALLNEDKKFYPNEEEIYFELFLNDWLPLYKKVWRALKYIFGYHCKYGHWENATLNLQSMMRLRDLLDKYINSIPEISKVIIRAKEEEEKGNVNEAIKMIYDSFNDMLNEGKFDEIDNFFFGRSPYYFSTNLILAILTVTLPAKAKLKRRGDFFTLAKRYLSNEKLEGLE